MVACAIQYNTETVPKTNYNNGGVLGTDQLPLLNQYCHKYCFPLLHFISAEIICTDKMSGLPYNVFFMAVICFCLCWPVSNSTKVPAVQLSPVLGRCKEFVDHVPFQSLFSAPTIMIAFR